MLVPVFSCDFGSCAEVSRKPTAVKSKLTFVKPAKSKKNVATVHHPLPYASRNMYYDERWAEKQERSKSCRNGAICMKYS